MLIWKKDEHRDKQQKIVSTNYLASIPYLGWIGVHPHIRASGEWFLACHSQGIVRHPLGSMPPEEAERLAENGTGQAAGASHPLGQERSDRDSWRI